MTAKKKSIKKKAAKARPARNRTSAPKGLSFKFGNTPTSEKVLTQHAFVDFLQEDDREPENVTEAFITEHFQNKFNAIIQHFELYGNSFSR